LLQRSSGILLLIGSTTPSRIRAANEKAAAGNNLQPLIFELSSEEEIPLEE
jgi:hypothetical protein